MRTRDGKFELMISEPVTVRKPDGREFSKVDAGIHSKVMMFNVPQLPLEPGDTVIRTLPNGITEEYEITEPGFKHEFHGIPAHFQARFRRKGAATGGSVINYTVQGNNARININSLDGSVNITATKDTVWKDLETVIEGQIAEQAEREKLLRLITAMKAAQGTDQFRDRYRDFVSAAADHMTILAPLVQAVAMMFGVG